MRHTRLLALTYPIAATLALTLGLGTARAQATNEAIRDEVKAVRELLKGIDERLARQQTTNDLLLEMVRKDLKDLRDEVARLQRELNDLRSRPNGQTTTANYGGTPPAGAPSTSLSVTGPTARVRLVNTHVMPMTALINGIRYTVPPGQEQTVQVQAGTMTYYVYQVPGPVQTRNLVPNETLTLNLFPTGL